MASANRSDDYFTARIALDYRFSRRWQGSVFYRYFKDSSNLGIGYEDNQVGVQALWRF